MWLHAQRKVVSEGGGDRSHATEQWGEHREPPRDSCVEVARAYGLLPILPCSEWKLSLPSSHF